MPGPPDVSGKPKANNVYAQKIVVKQAPVRVSAIYVHPPTMFTTSCLWFLLCRDMWVIRCRTCKSKDCCSQTRLAPLHHSGRSSCNPCLIVPQGKPSKCISRCSLSHHSRQVTNQMMTGLGHSQLPSLPTSKPLTFRLSHLEALSWHRMDHGMLHSIPHGRDQHLLLNEHRPQRLRTLMAVSNRQQHHDHILERHPQESQMMPSYPWHLKMCLGRWGPFHRCLIA